MAHAKLFWAKIASFRKRADGCYAGVLRTASLNLKLVLKPFDAENPRAPIFHVFRGRSVLGAVWPAAASGHLSFKLDDPTWREPLYFELRLKGQARMELYWARKSQKSRNVRDS